MRRADAGNVTPLKRFFPAAIFLSVALASLVIAWAAYVGVKEAARLKFEATADDALNRIESSIDLNLSLLTRDAGVLHDARRRRVAGRVQPVLQRAERRRQFPRPARDRLCQADANRRRGRGGARYSAAARDREAHLSRHRPALARADHDVRADRSRQSRRHRLRHVHRSVAARGAGSGDRIG